MPSVRNNFPDDFFSSQMNKSVPRMSKFDVRGIFLTEGGSIKILQKTLVKIHKIKAF